MVGSHLLKTWSSTQSSVALSSGEAEFYGAVKAAGYGLAYQSLLADLGVIMPITCFTDSSAAIGIASRQGLGKLRRLDVHTLWLQQAVRSKRISLRKVLGTENPADIFTKHQGSREKMLELVKLFDMEYREGRAEAAPELRREERPRVEMKEINDQDASRGRILPPPADEPGMAKRRAEPQEDGLNLLPHLQADMEERYPAIEAADDWESFDESCMYGFDHMREHGEKLASQIQEEADQNGRRRNVD